MPGLYLIIQPEPTGTKSWAYRYRFGGKTRKLTLGRYPKVDLAGARKLAKAAELEIRQGKDPAQAKAVCRHGAEQVLNIPVHADRFGYANQCFVSFGQQVL